MTDITKCEGFIQDDAGKIINCPLARECYRYNALADLYCQSYFQKPPFDPEKGTCDEFWLDKRPKETDHPD